MKKFIKERLVGRAGSVAGAASILGNYQLCHTVCLWIISLLALLGITIVGMPLLFFQKIAIPMWTIATVLLIISFIIYLKMKCISRNMLLFNVGVIIAGTPFQQVRQYTTYFWIVGGILMAASILFYIREKISLRKAK